MNPQPDPPHGEQAGADAGSRARLLADTSHDGEVFKNMLFTGIFQFCTHIDTSTSPETKH